VKKETFKRAKEIEKSIQEYESAISYLGYNPGVYYSDKDGNKWDLLKICTPILVESLRKEIVKLEQEFSTL